ncbi:MAG TPA: hypothetical protein VHD36_05940 [Pirellulales bacterium]|nr:hypothetical protein [Pirellulales bacterium]
MNERHSHDKQDAALDRLLAEARWPEPAPEQLARLRDHWRGLSRARRRRQFVLAGAAVAAAVLAIAGVTALWRTERGSMTATVAPEIAVVRPKPPAVVKQERKEPSAAPLVRDPTLYERVILASYAEGHVRPRKVAAKSKRASAAHIAADKSSNGPLANLPLSADSIAQRAGNLIVSGFRYYEQFRTAARRRGEQLVARTAALARRSQAVALAASPAGKAVESVVRTGEVANIVDMLVRQPHRELRRRLLRELLVRGTEESVGAFLTFVALPQSRAEALAALETVGPQPSAALLAFLRSPQAEVRNAAALALANSTNPEVIAALAAALGDAGQRQPALVALLLNPSAQAAAVLQEARGDLYLMASVRAAEFELQHVTNAHTR